MLIIIWISICLITIGLPILYYYYMKLLSDRPWSFSVSVPEKLPKISIIIPTFNEDRVINYKLLNLKLIDYPKQLLDIKIIDSASTDNTMKIVEEFIQNNPELNIEFITEKIRRGKSAALNNVLSSVKSDYFIISDADCYLPKDILKRTIPYFTNNQIGAVAGQEKILNSNKSWIIKNELKYKEKMSALRIGESKLDSTIVFEGGCGIYRKSSFPGFDEITGADDTGTAFNIVQSGKKSIVIPDLYFYTFFTENLKERTILKYRRANHIISVLIKAFKLILKNKLVLTKKITISMMFLYIINPILFLFLAYVSIKVLMLYNYILIIYLIILLIPYTRVYFIEFVHNNLILLLALFSKLLNKDIIMWSKIDSTREVVSKNILKENGLV